MAKVTVINNAVTETVILGGETYSNLITITSDGSIVPSLVGASAIEAEAKFASIINYGRVAGGNGGPSSSGPAPDGGSGIALAVTTHLTNFGTISGGAGEASYYHGGYGGVGVDLGHGGLLLNSGTIRGGTGGEGYFGGSGGIGVDLSSAATLTNSGDIFGGNAGRSDTGVDYPGNIGVQLNSGAILTNTGLISGGGYGGVGVLLNGGKLVDAGTISGGRYGKTDVAVQFGSGSGTLTLEAGATFEGQVLGNSNNDTLQLAGSLSGTITGLGVQISGFNSFLDIGGSSWTLSGDNVIDARVITVAGKLTDDGSLSLSNKAAGSGTIILSGGSTLIANSVLAVKEVDFSGNDKLTLTKAFSVSSTISGFTSGDTIDLKNLTATKLSFVGGILSVTNNGTGIEKIAMAGDYMTSNFSLAPDNAGGTDISFAPVAHDLAKVLASPSTLAKTPSDSWQQFVPPFHDSIVEIRSSDVPLSDGHFVLSP